MFYNTSAQPKRPRLQVCWGNMKLMGAMPCRFTSIQFCSRTSTKESLFHGLLSLWYRSSRSSHRVRLRQHFGTCGTQYPFNHLLSILTFASFYTGLDAECRKSLQSFGLPMEKFPAQEDGSIDLDYHRQWLLRRREIESRNESPTLLPSCCSPTSNEHDQAISPSCCSPTSNEHDQTISPRREVEKEPISASSEPNDFSATSPSMVHNALAINQHASMDSSPQQTATLPMFVDNPLTGTNTPAFPLSVGFTSPAHQASAEEFLYANNNFTPTPPSTSSTPFLPAPIGMPPQQLQQQQQQQMPQQQIIFVTPKSRDVLLGRGKPMRNHPGNTRFRNMLENHADEYNKAPKFVKSLIAKKLVQAVVSSGSRFLKPVGPNKLWVLVDEKAAQDKVSQYFRSHRGSK